MIKINHTNRMHATVDALNALTDAVPELQRAWCAAADLGPLAEELRAATNTIMTLHVRLERYYLIGCPEEPTP